MPGSEKLTDLIIYSIPALLVLFAIYWLSRSLLEEYSRRRKQEMAMERLRLTMPLRLQAMERMILFLERITAESLMRRYYSSGASAAEISQRIIQGIREEFDHNLSQQLYLTAVSWNRIRSAMEQMITHISYILQEPGSGNNDTEKTAAEGSETTVSARSEDHSHPPKGITTGEFWNAMLSASEPRAAIEQAILALKTEAAQLWK